MRLDVHPESLGAGSAAGSPSADHISRPKSSVKPATGFQAAVGRASMPSLSQPFHGKSLSLTVSNVLDPGRVVVIVVLTSDGIAGDGLMAAVREQSDKVAFEIDALGRVRVVMGC